MPEAPRDVWRRSVKALLIQLAVFVGVGFGALWALQERLIFHPAAESYAVPADGERVTVHLADGTPVVALWGAARADGAPIPDPRAAPTAVLCLGNGDRVARALGTWQGVRDLGANVLVYDYPGYGASGGTPSEGTLREAALSVYRAAAARPDVDPARIVAFGHSLGGAVAIDLASREPVAGLVALSTFTALSDMAWHLYFVPAADLLLRHHFRSADKLPGIDVPTFLAHGDADRVVPFTMLQPLREAAGGPVTVVEAPGATHSLLGGEAGAPVREALRSWFAALPARR